MGQQVPVYEEQRFNQGTEESSVHKNKNKIYKIVIFSLAGLILVAIAGYFIVDSLKDSSQKASPAATITKVTVTNQPAPETKEETSPKEDEETRIEHATESEKQEAETEIRSEDFIINFYTNKLNSLRIHTSSRDISVGRWTVSRQNGRLFLSATNIPSQNLDAIFGLYDTGNLEPLIIWGREVYSLAENASRELHAEWSIGVGNNCVGDYPMTLPSSDLIAYSGSCGYSIPVLSGSNRDDLSLVIYTRVFGHTTSKPPVNSKDDEFIFPESDFIRLTERELRPLTLRQLRLARNEIYARHGYIFESEDLWTYFSSKSWYHPDASYEGNELNTIEKYNVSLIQKREKELK